MPDALPEADNKEVAAGLKSGQTLTSSRQSTVSSPNMTSNPPAASVDYIYCKHSVTWKWDFTIGRIEKFGFYWYKEVNKFCWGW